MHERVTILGARVDLLTTVQLTEAVTSAATSRSSLIVANHNLHSLYLYHKHADIATFLDSADIVHADGMGIVLLGRLEGQPIGRLHRTTYVDWMPHLMEAANTHAWRIFHLGGTRESVEIAIGRLRELYPRAEFRGRNGYFDAAPESMEARQVLDDITEFKPHILFVGMGMPRQERWIAHNREALVMVPVILPSGACMDYVAGTASTPPRWAGRLGLEWLFRLASEPSRLWRRYLLEPWALILIFLRLRVARTRCAARN
jgi:N-acetylglucosaminyldiphosphoundecaprenol N-acetyl-beta-D-mannosaminyltransferase